MSATIRRMRNVNKVITIVHNRINEYVRTFARARREVWRQSVLIRSRTDALTGDAFDALPVWAQNQLRGAWDALHTQLQMEFYWTHCHNGTRRDAFSNNPARDGTKFNPYFDGILSTIDTTKSAHCYLWNGQYIPYDDDIRQWDKENNIQSVIA